MTTTHKNRASARKATAIGAERAGVAVSTASVPPKSETSPDRGQGARSPRTSPTLAALLVGAVLLGAAA